MEQQSIFDTVLWDILNQPFSDDVDYLHLTQDETVKSLQRSTRVVKPFKILKSYGLNQSFSDLKLNPLKLESLHQVLDRIVLKITKPMIDSSKTLDELNDKIELLLDGGHYLVSLEDESNSNAGKVLSYSIGEKKRKLMFRMGYDSEIAKEKILPVKVTVDSYGKKAVVFSLGKVKMLKSWIGATKGMRFSGIYYYTCDLSYLLARLYLYNIISNYLNVPANYSISMNSILEEYYSTKEFYVSLKKTNAHEIKSFVESQGYNVAVGDSIVISKEWIDLLMVGYDNVDLSSQFSLSALTNSDDSTFYLHTTKGYIESYLLSIVKLMLDDVLIVKEEMRVLNGMAKDYATAYKTKKNIPDKIVNRMKSSILNQYFYEVEFDEMVDLSNLSQIENEIVSVLKFLNYSDDKRDCIRFRKLGQHKAIGLYYPTLNTLCVDLRDVSGFVHEYFHSIDYSCGVNTSFSKEQEFYEIRSQYSRELKNKIAGLDKNSHAYISLTGRSKYNLNYYLIPTEIFARCGEYYFSKILGMNNSLCSFSPSSFAYDVSDDLKSKIEKYFEWFLKKNITNDDTVA